MATVALAKVDRKNLRTRSTRLVNKLTPGYMDGLNINELNTEQFQLQKFISELKVLDQILNDDLRTTQATEDDLLEADDKCQDYENKLRTCLSAVSNKIKDISLPTPSAGASPIGTVYAHNRSKMMLPNLTLPKFYADTSKDDFTCQTFINTLEHLLANYNLNDTEKYGMLEQQTFGRAKAMIKSLTLANRSYATARAILLKSFAEEVPQKFATIKKFNALKLKSTGDPYLYYAEFAQLIEVAREQKIDCDTFMQYYIWEGVPTIMQDILINVSQSNYPKLGEIVDHFLVASGRFEAQRLSKSSSDPSVSSHATHLQASDPGVSSQATHLTTSSSPQTKGTNATAPSKGKLSCCFCPSKGHTSARCPKYANSKTRRDRVTALKLCFKCLKSGHFSNSCTFQLNYPCRKCGKDHYSFLCDRSKTPNATAASPNKTANAPVSHLITCGTPTSVTVVPNTSTE